MQVRNIDLDQLHSRTTLEFRSSDGDGQLNTSSWSTTLNVSAEMIDKLTILSISTGRCSD